MVDRAKDEVAWVIERHRNSTLYYYTGKRPGWSPNHEDAVRFARREDGEVILSWQLGGTGNVVEHMWMA